PICSLCAPPPPSSTLFPYTTLFRSIRAVRCVGRALRRRLHHQAEQGTGRRVPEVEHRSDEEHDRRRLRRCPHPATPHRSPGSLRSEEHTSELQSRENLVCRLLLEKK